MALLNSRSVCWTLALAMLAPGICAQEQQTEGASGPQPSNRPIEEITVQGERTFYSLRVEIEDVENEVYAIFNELNSNDEFDVKCNDEVYTGSHIPERTCMAAYLRKAQAEATQRYLQGTDVEMTLTAVKSEVREKTQEMEAEMLRLAQENPRFAEALLRLTALAGRLEQKKAETGWFSRGRNREEN